MECDPARMCERLVGLGDVEVLGVDDEAGEPLRVHIRRRGPKPDLQLARRQSHQRTHRSSHSLDSAVGGPVAVVPVEDLV